MRYRKMTMQEKISLLRGDNDAVLELFKNAKHSRNIEFRYDKNGKAQIYKNIRNMVSDAVNWHEGATRYGIAKAVGIAQANFTRFMTGNATIRQDIVETLLWLIDDNATLVPREDE